MTTNTDILFNSIPRCGNTFLDFCFAEAIRQNLGEKSDQFYSSRQVYPHQHMPFLLRVNESNAMVTSFTIIRHPYQQVPSLFATPFYRDKWWSPGVRNNMNLEQRIAHAINEQKIWLSTQWQNGYANVILFEELIKDPNKILKLIFNKISIEFVKEIDIEKVKADVNQFTDDSYKDSNEKFFMGRLPRGFSETDQYKQIQSFLIDPKWQYHDKYLEILDLYSKVAQTKMGESI